MRVKIKLFSTLKRDQDAQVDLPGNATVKGLLSRLGIDPDQVGVLMVNARSATFDQALGEGDTVTIIPPIGGG